MLQRPRPLGTSSSRAFGHLELGHIIQLRQHLLDPYAQRGLQATRPLIKNRRTLSPPPTPPHHTPSVAHLPAPRRHTPEIGARPRGTGVCVSSHSGFRAKPKCEETYSGAPGGALRFPERAFWEPEGVPHIGKRSTPALRNVSPA